MPRRLFIVSDFCPYHVCARSNNRDWFMLPLDTVFGIYANLMERTIAKYRIECHAFVLMSNHFHSLVSTPSGNLSHAMRYFMSETSRAIARASGRINRIYGSRYHWTLIHTPEHYAHAFYYVYRNPIKHGAAAGLKDYPWSTLHPHHRKFNHLITPKLNGFEEYIPHARHDQMIWIERTFDPTHQDYVRKALRRQIFTFPTDPMSRKRPEYLDILPPKKTPTVLVGGPGAFLGCGAANG